MTGMVNPPNAQKGKGTMSLRLVAPPPTDPTAWKALLNFLYLHEQDDLFRWAKEVRAVVEEAEGKKAA